jgi:quercetin dioxygenase-like cupin family protein
MKIHELSNLPSREVFPGYTGRFVHGDNLTIAYWKIKAMHPLPEHAHVHEQVIYVVDGSFELTVAGEKHLLQSGSMLVIPSNIPHSGVGITDCTVIDTFYPVREDLRAAPQS